MATTSAVLLFWISLNIIPLVVAISQEFPASKVIKEILKDYIPYGRPVENVNKCVMVDFEQQLLQLTGVVCFTSSSLVCRVIVDNSSDELESCPAKKNPTIQLLIIFSCDVPCQDIV